METHDKVESVEKEISYFEKMILGSERLIRPWRMAVIALIVAWFLTVVGFLIYLNQYDFSGVAIEAMQDGSGINIVGGGDVNNGANSKNDSQKAN